MAESSIRFVTHAMRYDAMPIEAKQKTESGIRWILPRKYESLPDHQQQSELLEKLRYKHCYTEHALKQRIMQRLGDFGRWLGFTNLFLR